MKIGYLNAKSAKGSLSVSHRAFLNHKVDSTQVLSGVSKSDWDDFEAFLSGTKSGDIVVIYSLFDFCVSIKDLFRFASLALSSGVRIQSASEGWFDTEKSEASQAEFLGNVEAFYFECIARQTKKGLDRARRSGKTVGRHHGSRKISDEQLSHAYDDYYKRGNTMEVTCAKNSISQSTLYRYIRVHSLPTRRF